MKQEILEVITFLFQNYWHSRKELPEDSASLFQILESAGFEDVTIFKTFEWLEKLIQQQVKFNSFPTSKSMRIFTKEEGYRLNLESRNFILFLEKEDILTPKNREILLDQLLNLHDRKIKLSDVKWVALLVLFNEQGPRERLRKLENILTTI